MEACDVLAQGGEVYAERPPLSLRIYNPPGFTDRVLQVLRESEVSVYDWEDGRLYNCTMVPAKVLKRIASLLPREQLNDTWNGRPMFRDFLRVASRVNSAMFDLFVVTKERFDERVSVYAAWLPLYPPPLLKWAVDTLTSRAAPPSAVGVLRKGKYYLYLYWD